MNPTNIFPWKLPTSTLLLSGGLFFFYLLVPSFTLKLVLLGAFFTLLLRHIQEMGVIKKEFLIFLLLFLFSFSFLAVPYWASKGELKGEILGIALLSICYLLFCFFTPKYTEAIEIGKSPPVYLLFGALFLFYGILQYVTLQNSMPYKGDNDFFVKSTFRFLLYFARPYNIPWVCLIGISGFFYFKRKKTFFLFALGGLAFGLSLSTFIFMPQEELTKIIFWIQRYPILYFYPNSLLSIPLPSAFFNSLALQEGFFRLQSFLSILLFACIGVQKSTLTGFFSRFLLGVAVITTPVLSYYATLSYIEPIMLVFILYALLSYEKEIVRFFITGKIPFVVFALYIVFSLKETTLIYGIAFWMMTALLLLRQSGLPLKQKVSRLFFFSFFTLSPLILFLYFRSGSGVRPYRFHPEHLLFWRNYEVWVESFWVQFSLFFPLALLAVIYLGFRRRYTTLLLNSLIMGGYFVLFMGDESRSLLIGGEWATAYVGYSRFNLYFFPCVFSLVISALQEGKIRKETGKIFFLTGTILTAIIVVNLVMSPIHFGKGIREAHWGDHVARTSEFDYPYRRLFHWLLENHAEGKRILFLGRDSVYFDDFYKVKHSLSFQKIEILLQDFSLDNPPDLSNYDWIVYHDEIFNLQGEALEKARMLKERLKSFRLVTSWEKQGPAIFVYSPSFEDSL